jgi:hypothetical protein
MNSDIIHVTLKEDEALAHEPGRYDFVIDVSRKAIMDDLKDEHSIVRQNFRGVDDLDAFVDANLADVQATIAGQVALTYARRKDSSRLNWRPVKSELRIGQRPRKNYDGAVGQFGVWIA